MIFKCIVYVLKYILEKFHSQAFIRSLCSSHIMTLLLSLSSAPPELDEFLQANQSSLRDNRTSSTPCSLFASFNFMKTGKYNELKHHENFLWPPGCRQFILERVLTEAVNFPFMARGHFLNWSAAIEKPLFPPDPPPPTPAPVLPLSTSLLTLVSSERDRCSCQHRLPDHADCVSQEAAQTVQAAPQRHHGVSVKSQRRSRSEVRSRRFSRLMSEHRSS